MQSVSFQDIVEHYDVDYDDRRVPDDNQYVVCCAARVHEKYGTAPRARYIFVSSTGQLLELYIVEYNPNQSEVEVTRYKRSMVKITQEVVEYLSKLEEVKAFGPREKLDIPYIYWPDRHEWSGPFVSIVKAEIDRVEYNNIVKAIEQDEKYTKLKNFIDYILDGLGDLDEEELDMFHTYIKPHIER